MPGSILNLDVHRVHLNCRENASVYHTLPRAFRNQYCWRTLPLQPPVHRVYRLLIAC